MKNIEKWQKLYNVKHKRAKLYNLLNIGLKITGKYIDDFINLFVIQHEFAYNVVIDFNRSGQWRPWGSRSGAGGKK